jgi:hypothetical protein
MDLLQLLPVDCVDVKLKHPVTGVELDATINVFGKDSSVFQNAIKQRAKAQIARKSKDIDLDANDKDSIELLADCTQGWSGIAEGSKELVFSRDAAITLYTKYKWIREQIDIAIGDRANFFINA